MKKQLLLLLTIEAIMTSMSMNAQVFQMVGSDHGLSIEDVHLVEAGKAWGSIDGAVDISNAFATNHSIYDCKTHDYIKVLIDGNEILTSGGVRGNDNPHDEDGGNPALTLKTPVSGSVIQLDAKKNGFVYIVARLSTNKQYMVFEDGSAMGYKIAMEVDDNRIPSSVLNLEIKGEGEYNYIPEGRQVQWVIREYLNDAEAATAGNGLGVLYFPVVKGRKYLAHATGSKINWCGIYFSEMEPFSIKVVKESGAELYLTENIIEKDGIIYGLSSPYTVGIYSLNNEVENVNIPQTIIHNDKTYYVTSISSSAFRGCSFLTSITIPNSVTSIGDNAFYGCSSLESITIPNSVTTIGSSAFSGCSGLTAVNIPNSITSISESAFRGCSSLTSVTIPNSVTSIAGEAFSGCSSLTAITITSSAISINSSAFSSCSELKTIYYNCKEIGDVIPSAIKGNITNIIIGDEITSIPNNAFSGFSSLSSVTIPNSVTDIGGSAFYGCSSLTAINIPNSVTSIGGSAFQGCSSLTAVNIPNSVTSISDGAFYGCSGLTSVTIPNSVTSIGNYAFSGCSGLTSVTIPNSVTSIGNSAFRDCSGLTAVTIPNSVTSIGNYAFSGCSGLTSVTIPNSVTSIGEWAFSVCSGLTSVTIPNSVTSIGNSAFRDCSGLTAVTIPNSVTSIGGNAFYGCSGLTTITIPNSVTSIEKYAFDGCDNLLTVNSEILEPFNCPNAFSTNTQRKGTLIVPAGTMDLYTRFDGWREFLKIEEAGRTYQLSFVVNNNLLSSQDTETGATITPPTRDNEGNTISWYTYPETMPAYNLVVYGMTSQPVAPTKYTITYVVDGQTYRSVTVDEGATVSKEKAPYKEGYTFNGWQNEPTTMPANNVTVSGSFSINTYRLAFIVENKELSKQDVTYGSAITTPSKDSEGYTISWYSHPATMPAYNLVVYGMVEPAPETFVWLTVKDGQGTTKMKVKQGAEQTLTISPEEGWKLLSVTMDGTDVTDQVKDGASFTTPAINSDATIIIVYEQDTPSGVRTTRSQADIKVVSDGVVISNAEPQSRCIIYGSDGQQVMNTVINDGTRKIALQQGQVYILTINDRTLKFAL